MTLQIPFSLPPDNLELASDEVHVFCAPLEQPVTRLEQFRETMSPDELQRAARFRFEKDRNFFVAGRGMLREILGWLLDMKPSELGFSYGNHGKPRLAATASKKFLHFNVAHSDSLVVYAVARDREVGVDVERIRPIPEADDIAARFLSEQERRQWRVLPDDAKTAAFFNCWVRKEALLKARGKGIGGPLNQTVAFFGGDFWADAQFFLHSLQPAVNYTAAVSAQGREQLIYCWAGGLIQPTRQIAA